MFTPHISAYSLPHVIVGWGKQPVLKPAPRRLRRVGTVANRLSRTSVLFSFSCALRYPLHRTDIVNVERVMAAFGSGSASQCRELRRGVDYGLSRGS